MTVQIVGGANIEDLHDADLPGRPLSATAAQ
jgi:hypothetical protein